MNEIRAIPKEVIDLFFELRDIVKYFVFPRILRYQSYIGSFRCILQVLFNVFNDLPVYQLTGLYCLDLMVELALLRIFFF